MCRPSAGGECGSVVAAGLPKVAAIQMTSGRDVAANLSRASVLLREASGKGAELAVLPENFAFLGMGDAERLTVVERWGEGPIQTFLKDQAVELGVWLVGGTIALRAVSGGKEEQVGALSRSASLLIDPRGEVKARYDKIHLFDAGTPGSAESYQESTTTQPGTDVVSANTPLGRIGIAVCYDLRFPALFDLLGGLGTEILTLPAAFTVPMGEAHWSVLTRARAVEALAYAVAAAQWGDHDSGRKTYGHSMIVDPWGVIIAERDAGAGVIMADLDMMALQHRRQL